MRRLPDRGDLPDDIAPLNDAQGYELGVDRMWRPTLSELLDDLGDLLQDHSGTQLVSQTPAESRAENAVTVGDVKPACHEAEPRAPETEGIFISYTREDADAAVRLSDAITSLGGDVWLDERLLRAGETWEARAF